MCGDQEKELIKNKSKQWHYDELNSSFVIINNAGHCANMDNATDFNTIVNDFLQETR